MNEHTPGPWEVWENVISEYGIPVGPERGGVAVCDVTVANGIGVVTPETREAATSNARLIAAAPDMYDALIQAVKRIELANAEGDPILSAWLPTARAALAKGKGEGR